MTRVKAIAFHPTESRMAMGMHSGRVTLYDEKRGSIIHSVRVPKAAPVRTIQFVACKHWLLVGSDDAFVYVFDHRTMEKIKAFKAHVDFIRWIEVHPTLPCFLSASDDTTIKLWNWDRNFDCQQVFKGHAHYVMQVKINPSNTNTFASAALDTGVKLFSLNSSVAQHTLTGHDRGVNSVEYFQPGEKPYLVSAADDCSIKVWNYQTKSLVCTLTGHTNNVSAVVFHPRLPLFISVSEDHTAHVYNCTTFKCETVVATMDRAWTVAASPRLNTITVGSCAGWESIELYPEQTETIEHAYKELLCAETTVELSPRFVLQSRICAAENDVRLEGQVVDIACDSLVVRLVRHDKEPISVARQSRQECPSLRCFLITGCLSVAMLAVPELVLLCAAWALIGFMSYYGSKIFLSHIHIQNSGQGSGNTDDIELGVPPN